MAQTLYKISPRHEKEIIRALEDFEIDECHELDFTEKLKEEITGRNYLSGTSSEMIEGFLAGYISCMKWHNVKPKVK